MRKVITFFVIFLSMFYFTNLFSADFSCYDSEVVNDALKIHKKSIEFKYWNYLVDKNKLIPGLKLTSDRYFQLKNYFENGKFNEIYKVWNLKKTHLQINKRKLFMYYTLWPFLCIRKK